MTEPETNQDQIDENSEQAAEETVPVELTIEEQLAQAINAQEELTNRLARSQAEMENFRRRTRKEVEENRQFQSLNMIRSLLPAIDNLQRALQAAESATKVEDLRAGVEMVAKQFGEILTQHSVLKIEALEQPFDPNLHEALQQVPTADFPPMTVMQELEPGYTMHDRVVRPSKVIVSQSPPEPKSAPEE